MSCHIITKGNFPGDDATVMWKKVDTTVSSGSTVQVVTFLMFSLLPQKKFTVQLKDKQTLHTSTICTHSTTHMHVNIHACMRVNKSIILYIFCMSLLSIAILLLCVVLHCTTKETVSYHLQTWNLHNIKTSIRVQVKAVVHKLNTVLLYWTVVSWQNCKHQNVSSVLPGIIILKIQMAKFNTLWLQTREFTNFLWHADHIYWILLQGKALFCTSSTCCELQFCPRTYSILEMVT